jgi:hypothetical protein
MQIYKMPSFRLKLRLDKKFQQEAQFQVQHPAQPQQEQQSEWQQRHPE